MAFEGGILSDTTKISKVKSATKTRPLLAFRVDQDLIVSYKKFCADNNLDQSAMFKKIMDLFLNGTATLDSNTPSIKPVQTTELPNNDTQKEPQLMDQETQQTWRILCYEIGVDQSVAYERIIKYMMQPGNLEAVRIITSGAG